MLKMTPMAYIMNLMKDGESYTIVIPAAEYFQIGKDPRIIAKYWEQLSKERAKNKEKLALHAAAESQHSSKDGDQQNKELPSDKKDKSYWDTKTAGHLISLCHKHGVDIDNPELNSTLWNKISSEMNEQFPMFSISGEHCWQAFRKFVSAYKTIKSDPEKTGLKGELFAAVDRLVHAETNCQTTILQKDNAVDLLEKSEAELSLNNKTCDSKNHAISSKNHTEVTGKMQESSQKKKVTKKLKMHKTSKPNVRSNASQAMLNSTESALSKRVKKRNTIQLCKKNSKKIKCSVSLSPSNLIQTSVSYQTVKLDPEKAGLQEHFTAVDRLVHTGTDCQTTILQKNKAVLERSEAELSLRNNTCDSKNPTVSPKNYSEISEKMPDSSEISKMCMTSKSRLHSNASQAVLNSVLSKRMKKRNTVQPFKKNNKKIKSFVSSSPSNLIQTSVSYQTIKSAPEKAGLQELFTAVDQLVDTETDCQATILQKDNTVLERSEAECSLRNDTCDLKDPTVSFKNYTEVSGKMPVSSKRLKMRIASKSHLRSTASQAILNPAESVLLKRAKKTSTVQPYKKNSKKIKSAVSLSLSNLNRTSVSRAQVKPKEKDISETASQSNEICKTVSEIMSQGDKPCKNHRSCSCQNTLPPKWFSKFEKQFECRWEHLAKMAQDQITAVNDLVRVLRQWVNFERDLQTTHA